MILPCHDHTRPYFPNNVNTQGRAVTQQEQGASTDLLPPAFPGPGSDVAHASQPRLSSTSRLIFALSLFQSSWHVPPLLSLPYYMRVMDPISQLAQHIATPFFYGDNYDQRQGPGSSS